MNGTVTWRVLADANGSEKPALSSDAIFACRREALSDVIGVSEGTGRRLLDAHRNVGGAAQHHRQHPALPLQVWRLKCTETRTKRQRQSRDLTATYKIACIEGSYRLLRGDGFGARREHGANQVGEHFFLHRCTELRCQMACHCIEAVSQSPKHVWASQGGKGAASMH